jgi:hypothetical protein
MSSGTYAFGKYLEVICRTEYGIKPVKAKVVYDHHDGKSYDELTDICDRFERRRD